MASKKGIPCPEKAPILNDEKSLSMTDAQLDGLNFETGVPLKTDGVYLIVPQSNTACEYTINKRKTASRRFWAVEMASDGTVVERRTIGLSSLRGMYIDDAPESAVAPTFDVNTNEAGYLRAQGVSYQRALDDTSFIRGNKDSKRAEITKPVLIKCHGRKPVFVFDYEQKADGNPGGHVKCNAEGRALAAKNVRFYKFSNMSAPTEAQIATALEALAGTDGYYPLNK